MSAAVTAPRAVASTDTQEALVTVDGLWKQFRTRTSLVTALAGVDLNVNRGEFVSFVGPSGCGKSTLMSVIAGLETATTGDVKIAGDPVKGPHPDMGVVFQRDLLLEWRTALENVLLPFSMQGERARPHATEAKALLELVGLGHAVDRLPWQLSGGMRQRVTICRALVRRPELLLMDEPFGALDALTREQLHLDLARLVVRDNTTCIFITHDVEEAVLLSDRVIVMAANPGRIVADMRVDVPRPRALNWRDSEEFRAFVVQARGYLREGGVAA